jgi:hypothetical protein
MFESRDGLGKLPELRANRTQKVPRLGVAGVDLNDMFEGVDGLLGIAAVLCNRPRLYQAWGIVRKAHRCLLEKLAGSIEVTKV